MDASTVYCTHLWFAVLRSGLSGVHGMMFAASCDGTGCLNLSGAMLKVLRGLYSGIDLHMVLPRFTAVEF